MRDFKKRRDTGYEIFNFAALVIGMFFVLGLSAAGVQAAWGMYTKFVVASQGHAAAEHELGELQKQYARVSVAVADLSSDRGVEGQVRERFGVARPGEGTIQIIRNSTSTAQAQPPVHENFFARVFRTFFVQ